ncbi:MAG: tRNA-dihydrouridine synthase, partial [Candidatus Saccharimonas sp.]
EWRAWLTTLLQQDIVNLTIHLRTKKEMSKVAAHYELIDDIVALRDAIAPQTLLTINGDIRDRAHGMALVATHPGVNGVMIGRGVFADPFCFAPCVDSVAQGSGSLAQRNFALLRYH